MTEKQYIVFTLDDEEYAIDIVKIHEINRVSDFKIFKFPKAPEYIEGIINLRGDIVPILNVKKFMHSKINSTKKCARTIIVNVEGKLIGILVNEVSSVIKISENEMCTPCKEILSKYNFIQTIGKKNNRAIFVLNIQKIFNGQ